MLKRIGFLQLLILGVVSNTMAQQFTIKGSIGKKAEGSTVIVRYSDGGVGYKSDSAKVKNGKFVITGNIKEPVKGFLYLFPVKKSTDSWPKTDDADLFLEPMTIRLNSSDGKISTATIKGGAGQLDLDELEKRLKPSEDRMKPLTEAVMKDIGNDEGALPRYRKLTAPILEEMDKISAAFVADFPDSYLSLSIVKDKSAIIDVEKFEPLFNTLSERLRNTDGAKAIAARLAVAKKVAIGQVAPDFVLNDTSNAPVSLSSLKGKYVLVDFWASWCGPCRMENPNLTKAYEKYAQHNFEILGVSIDAQRAPWLKAVKEDALKWLQVLNIKGVPNDVQKQYDIKAVPQNFLLDPNGVVIAKNLRGEQLEEKLSEIFKN